VFVAGSFVEFTAVFEDDEGAWVFAASRSGDWEFCQDLHPDPFSLTPFP